MAGFHARHSLTHALSETIAAFSVYRTYLREGVAATQQDILRVQRAVRTARRRSVSVSPAVFAFLEDVLLLRTEAETEERAAQVRFALRFQQLTGPVMAKSVEDTAFYRYHRFVGLNEVGGSPERFGTAVADFHRANAERARSWPLSMISTSTHDTKRGEDAAARLVVISELAEEWCAAVTRWSQLTRPFKVKVDGEPAPGPGLEYLIYQTVIGACSLERARHRVRALVRGAPARGARHATSAPADRRRCAVGGGRDLALDSRGSVALEEVFADLPVAALLSECAAYGGVQPSGAATQ